MKLGYFRFVPFVFLFGCAGFGRSCTAFEAENFGSSWVIVQLSYDGTPFNCWLGKDISIANEQASDGIYWTDEAGNLVHIGGWYNRVQVENGKFDQAAKSLGVDIAKCRNGRYEAGKIVQEPEEK